MSSSLKNTWWVFVIIVVGGVIFFLALWHNKPQEDQGVVLNDIFHQPISNAESAQGLPVKKADPLPPMAIVANSADGHQPGFTIQVYSFQDKNRAQAALQGLKNSGYQAFLIMSDLGPKGIWYRVRVAGIADQDAARKTLNDIRKNYNSGFILKVKDEYENTSR